MEIPLSIEPEDILTLKIRKDRKGLNSYSFYAHIPQHIAKRHGLDKEEEIVVAYLKKLKPKKE